jgi:hypothetical protein
MDAAQSGIQAFINTLYDIDTTVSGFLNDPGVQANISSSTGMPFKDWKDALDHGTEVNIKKIQLPKMRKALSAASDTARKETGGKGTGMPKGLSAFSQAVESGMPQYEAIAGRSGRSYGEPSITGYRAVITPGRRGRKAEYGPTISVAEYNAIRSSVVASVTESMFGAQQKHIQEYQDFIDNPPPQFGETPYFDIFGDWPDFTAPISEPTTGLIPDAPFVDVPAETPDATFTGEDPRLTDEGQYTPPDPTVQEPEPGTETGLVTEPEPTPVETPTETPTETPGDQGLFEFNQKNIDELLASEPVSTALQRAQATQADADATPSDKNNAWKTALGVAVGTAGLSFGLSRLFRSDNGETTDGDINNLPRLNLNLPSSNRLGLNFSNTGGLTPVPPPALATLPTGVQSGEGIPLGKFEYKDDYDYVGYPLL